MDRFQAMKMFTRVVETNSFSKAADSMDLPHASATMIIQKLEAHLRVRLLQRTTRRLSLTPEGAEYYERCVRILAEVDETEGSLSDTRIGPRGRLRVDMPGSIGRLLIMPHIDDFRSSFPEIDLMVSFCDRNLDLIQEGVDCAIRVGALQDSTLVARRLALLPTVTAASASYVEQYGIPEDLDELAQHVAVHYFSSATGRLHHMNFIVDGKPVEVKVPGSIAVSDAEAYVLCGMKGAGLIQPAQFIIQPALQSAAMLRVLPQFASPPLQVSAVYPHNSHLAPKVRVFVEWVASIFNARLSVVPTGMDQAPASAQEKLLKLVQPKPVSSRNFSSEYVR
ncbi:LysR family transcriptional regulator [Paraburkholderia sp. BL25I1N1]|uniref:LysR family transcriptional regulator n=1 Tax=Paraburkholderia sp. BL25I1N1 TaxID=1938804 RepID=UPI000D078266|nr:LysR family transcriptional regulator [Paraburkholderia sp. BL25I1N1]PRY04448.1 LysR family transcriptional regulator for bpeEF and oprC [Paraburkholderia sp. BL25I1N1]